MFRNSHPAKRQINSVGPRARTGRLGTFTGKTCRKGTCRTGSPMISSIRWSGDGLAGETSKLLNLDVNPTNVIHTLSFQHFTKDTSWLFTH